MRCFLEHLSPEKGIVMADNTTNQSSKKVLYLGLGCSLVFVLGACQPPSTANPQASASQPTAPLAGSASPGLTTTPPSGGQTLAPFTLPRLGARTLFEADIPTADLQVPLTAASGPVPGSTPGVPTPLPAATSDISVIEKTTFNGKLFDDLGVPLDGATVKVRSLNPSVPFEAETVTVGGTFAFNNAPSGVQVEITTSKAGYATRKRVEVLKSNKQGDPNANRYDFGAGQGQSAPVAQPAFSAPPILPSPLLPPMASATVAEPQIHSRSNQPGSLSYQGLVGKSFLEKLKTQIQLRSPISSSLLLPWEALRLEPLNFSNLGFVEPFQVGMGLIQVAAGGSVGQDIYEWGGQMRLPSQSLLSRPPVVLTLLIERSALMGSFRAYASGSIAPPSLWDLTKQAVQSFTAGLKSGDRINLLVFSEQSETLISGLDFSSGTPLTQALQSQTPKGQARLLPALTAAYALAESQSDPSKNQRLLLLCSGSGLSVGGQQTEILNLVESKAQSGLPLSVVALGELADRALLENLQNKGRGVSRQLLGQSELDALFQTFSGLLLPPVRLIRFRLEVPPGMTLIASSSSLQGGTQHWSGSFLPGEMQIFWQRFAVPSGQTPSGVFRLHADYLNGAGQPQTATFEQSFANLVGQNASAIRDAGMIGLLYRLLAGQTENATVQTELNAYYGAQNTTLSNEYRSLIQVWSGQ